jgi:hypothetical protein
MVAPATVEARCSNVQWRLGDAIGFFLAGGETHDPAAAGRLMEAVTRATGGLAWHHLRAADFPLPGLVAPVSVVPSAVPLPVPALGVIPEE